MVRLLFLVAVAFSVVASGQDEHAKKRSQQAEGKAKAMLGEIHSEIKSLGRHEWAGAYYEGDGLGENVSLAIAPKAGYVFEWHGCMGLYDRNYGAVNEVNGRLRLTSTFKNSHEGFEGLAEEFIPIWWGKRRYLVPSNDVVGFCNAVNGGSEPRSGRHGRYLLCEGDEKKKFIGWPAVPVEFKPYLLPHPVKGEIVAISKVTTRPSSTKKHFTGTAITLNVGRKNGLLPGMELYVTKPDDLVMSVTVSQVEETSARGIMTQSGDDKSPRVGWELSTRPRWASAEVIATQPSGGGQRR
jgi:hypothetical protein